MSCSAALLRARLADRTNDAGCKVMITQDTSYRRGADVLLQTDRG